MNLFTKIAAGACALGGVAMMALPAGSAPLSITGPGASSLIAQPGGELVHKVSGCHANPAFHTVFQWGYQAWHQHYGPGCQPVPIQQNPGWGGAPGWGNYCHGNWENHFHPGWGGGWHRHSSKNCKPRAGRKWQGGSKKNCVNIAGIWICG